MRIWIAIILVGCGGNKAAPRDSAADSATDVTLDAARDTASDIAIDAPVTFGPWGTPVEVMTPGGEEKPTLTADMLELYFDISPTIYVMTRATTGDAWTSPAPVTELSGFVNTVSPEVSGDGLTMFLTSRHNGTSTQEDIYMSTRPDRQTAWSTPAIVSELSTNQIDIAAAATDDLLTLVMERYVSAQADLFITSRAAITDPWGPLVALDTVNSGLDDGNPFLWHDKKTLYFSSTIGGGGDLYVSDNFSAPQPITELNIDFTFDGEPWVSPDGHDIYFTSERSGTSGLYHSTR